MQIIRGDVVRSGIAVLTLFLVFVVQSPAQERPTDVPATIIAHLPLPHPTGSQLLLQRDNNKNYLYVQQASKQGFMIVDVTNPEFPHVLKRMAESVQATAGTLEIVSPDVAIAAAPERKPTTLTSTNRPTETVRVLDMSDPRNPKTIEEFNGVTSFLPDGGHGLIYLTNTEGLWILRYSRPSFMEPAQKKPPCNSESVIQAMPPDCG
jgi:hypothetical protein